MKNIKEIVFGTSFFFEIDWRIFLCKMLIKSIIEKHAIVIAGLLRRKYFGEKCNQFVFVRVFVAQQMVFLVMPIIGMRHYVRKNVHSLRKLFLHRVEQIKNRQGKHKVLFKGNM
mgnify:FL=1